MLDLKPIRLDDLNNPHNLLQSRFWGYLKEAHGQAPLCFEITWKGRADHILVLLQQVSPVLKAAYLPWAPNLEIEERQRAEFLSDLSLQMREYLPKETLFIRYDLPWESPYADDEELPADHLRELRMNFGSSGRALRKAPTDIQPVDTRIVDLTRSPDQLLMEMHSKTRYNIRLSQRRGVKVRRVPSDRLPEWYRL
ncbi:MAG TPA: peptidoglycan bridge formation glycyltransferase FemA/FemB family protein, partial [Sediminispirochaeta sp.]|nr:peptidoglycan bridge formation glycyltransferase FemA/FemB family protein [Sediminispirochaeta sp.]